MKKVLAVLGGALLVTMAAGSRGTRLAVPFWIPPQPPKAIVSIPVAVDPVQPVAPTRVGPVTMRVTPSQTRVAGPGELFVHIAVRAPGEGSKSHVPTDWILVIDRSGSMMARGKMKHAKAAARLLATNLDPSDRIALVGFDHVASILHPLGPISDKDSFGAAVEGLFPRGSTNILEGLTLGLSAVDRSATDRQRRILFMTDGMDSLGEQNSHTMREMAKKAGLEGIAITTMGMGAEFQEDLLVQIAEASGGRYAYLADPAQMSTLYRDELTQGGAVRATDLKLTLNFAPAVKATSLLGTASTPVGPGTSQVLLGSLAAGETRNLVVRLEHTGAAAPMLSLALEGRAVGEKAGPVALHQTVAIEGAASADEADATLDPLVLAFAGKMQASYEVEAALNLVSQGKKQEAQQKLQEQLKSFDAGTARGAELSQDRKNVEQVLKDVEALQSSDAESVGSFVKQQKWNAYQWRR